MIQCVNCEAVRYYWIFLQLGRSGWLLEIPEAHASTIWPTIAKIIYNESASGSVAAVDQHIPQTGRLVLSK